MVICKATSFHFCIDLVGSYELKVCIDMHVSFMCTLFYGNFCPIYLCIYQRVNPSIIYEHDVVLAVRLLSIAFCLRLCVKLIYWRTHFQYNVTKSMFGFKGYICKHAHACMVHNLFVTLMTICDPPTYYIHAITQKSLTLECYSSLDKLSLWTLPFQ